MAPVGQAHSLHSLVQVLGRGTLSQAETLFLVRRLSYARDAEAWRNLAAQYGHKEPVLREIERRILIRANDDGLAEVRAWLETPDHDTTGLAPHEAANLSAMVEYALLLHAILAKRPERIVDPTPLLTAQPAARPSARNSQPPSNPLSFPPPATLALARERGQPEPPAREAALQPRTPQPTAETGPRQPLAACPSALLNNVSDPSQFFQMLWGFYQWLSQVRPSVRAVQQQLSRQWPALRRNDLPGAFDVLWVFGLVGPLRVDEAASALVEMPVGLAVADFRRQCAERFSARVQGNDRLLAALDLFGSADEARLAKAAFGAAVAPADVPYRLAGWAALGAAQREKRAHWRITEAGRGLAAALPPVRLNMSEAAEAPVDQPDDSWLNVL